MTVKAIGSYFVTFLILHAVHLKLFTYMMQYLYYKPHSNTLYSVMLWICPAVKLKAAELIDLRTDNLKQREKC